VRPTRLSLLLLVAVAAGAVVYLLARAYYASFPPIPLTAPLLIGGFAVLEALLALSVRARLAGRPGTRPIMPFVVVRVVALAKASSLVGSLVLGGYGGLLAFTAGTITGAGQESDDARITAVGVATSALLVAAALILERVCRVPKPPEAEPDGPDDGG
jgi:hypothetical protein